MKMYTYLNYGGNCAQAFRFYEQHLGGKITMMMTHGQQPDPSSVPPDWKDAILHARMSLGETELLDGIERRRLAGWQPTRQQSRDHKKGKYRSVSGVIERAHAEAAIA